MSGLGFDKISAEQRKSSNIISTNQYGESNGKEHAQNESDTRFT